jgi:hypothetical protein
MKFQGNDDDGGDESEVQEWHFLFTAVDGYGYDDIFDVDAMV